MTWKPPSTSPRCNQVFQIKFAEKTPGIYCRAIYTICSQYTCMRVSCTNEKRRLAVKNRVFFLFHMRMYRWIIHRQHPNCVTVFHWRAPCWRRPSENRSDPRFPVGCRKRRLNQAMSVLHLIPCFLLRTFCVICYRYFDYVLLFCVFAVCFVSWLFLFC